MNSQEWLECHVEPVMKKAMSRFIKKQGIENYEFVYIEYNFFVNNVQEWLDEHCTEYFKINVEWFAFKNKEDAMLLKLTWG